MSAWRCPATTGTIAFSVFSYAEYADPHADTKELNIVRVKGLGGEVLQLNGAGYAP
jgi:hypothetical protein